MLAVYVWGQQLGTILGLILGGYIAEGPGWRWAYRVVAILSVCSCVVNVLLITDFITGRCGCLVYFHPRRLPLPAVCAR